MDVRNNKRDLVHAILKQWIFAEDIIMEINLFSFIYLGGNSISGNFFIALTGKVNFCKIYELKNKFSQFNITWDLIKHKDLGIRPHLGRNDSHKLCNIVTSDKSRELVLLVTQLFCKDLAHKVKGKLYIDITESFIFYLAQRI